MARYDSIAYLGPQYFGEKCKIVPDVRRSNDLAGVRYGMEVTHNWSVWPDDPPRYKVCTRCHKTRALTPDEVAALLPPPTKVVPVLEPEKKAKRTRAKKTREEKAS